MSTLMTLAILTVIPLLFLSATSFVKLSIVFSILRNALGTGQVPSGAVITVLALLLSAYIMAPVGEAMMLAAGTDVAQIDPDRPFEKEALPAWVRVMTQAKEPLLGFLKQNSGERERTLFFELAKKARRNASPDAVTAEDFLVLLPAFLFTELTEAFVIGFLVFLPFLVLDLAVANVLLALGVQAMAPSQVALPLKLLLFVAVDGWVLLAESLVLGYGIGG